MLKRSLKKVGLSLLFAGVLSVGLSINSASAITEYTKYQEELLGAVENVVKATEINGKEGPNNWYGANDFWKKVAGTVGKKLDAVRNLFSKILVKKGVVLEKNNHWIEIFEPYKEELKRNSGLKLSAFIASKANPNSGHGSGKKREIWTDEDNKLMNDLITKHLKNLKGSEISGNFWSDIREKYNSDAKSCVRNASQMRKHFNDLYFSEEVKKGEHQHYITVLNEFSKHIKNNPKNYLSLEDYIMKVKIEKMKLPDTAALVGVSETHNYQEAADRIKIAKELQLQMQDLFGQ